jgi:type VI secretion system protein ImpM
VTEDSSAAIPGWYGKLPALGDFASRRLPSDFIHAWDEWLQAALEAARIALGVGWLDCYLTTPIWRFTVLPGLVGESGWAGVLMPSVDRVGRQFPLTVAVPLSSHAAAAALVFGGSDWFARLEDAALAILDVTRDADDLDGALADCPFIPPAVAEPDDAGSAMRELPSAEAFEPLARAEALRAWAQQAGWKALWWTRGRVDDRPLMLASTGLPTAEEFTWLLRGRSTPPTAPAARDATALL